MQIFGQGLQSFYADKAGEYLPPFKPRFPWVGADLQTLRNNFVKRRVALVASRRLLAPIEGTEQALNLATFEPKPEVANGRAIVLVHGLGGSEASSYMESAVHYFLKDGWAVYCMNYRGVGPSAATSKPPYSGGLTGDLRSVLNAVSDDVPDRDIYLMGFSLGGQLVLRTLGEGNVPRSLKAAVTVSAPLDLAKALAKLERPRNHVYVRYLVNNMMRDLGQVGEIEFGVSRDKLTSVWAFDEYIIGPAFGFENAAAYYAGVSCLPLLKNIKIPVLAMHSRDDPWIPWEDYVRADWPEKTVAGAVLLRQGGHVGFHCREIKGVWFEKVASLFLKYF